jgi:hypothetical protein
MNHFSIIFELMHSTHHNRNINLKKIQTSCNAIVYYKFNKYIIVKKDLANA